MMLTKRILNALKIQSATTALVGAVLALFDMFAASYQQYWTADPTRVWPEAGLSFAIYSAALIVAPAVLLAVTAVALRKRTPPSALTPLAITLTALAIWFVLSANVPNPDSVWWALVPVSVVAIPAFIWGLAVRAGYQGPRLSLALFFVVCSTATALMLNGRAFTFEAAGPDRARKYALIWMGLLTCLIVALVIVDKRRSLKPATFVLVAILLASLYPAGLATQRYAQRFGYGEASPNVMIVTIDTLRADACSVYGGAAQTPAMKAIAEDGVVFERCYSLSPWTIPSLDGLFTSRYPPGLTPNAPHAQRQQEGLSYAKLTDYWQDADGLTFIDRINKDYQTVAINGNPTLDSQRWLLDRFDRYLLVDALNDQEPKHLANAPLLRAALARFWPTLNDTRFVDTTARITEYAANYLRAANGKPFFLWIHYMDPHGPYNPPQRFRSRPTPWDAFPPAKSFAAKMALQLSDADRDAARSLYYGEIEYVDNCIGTLTRQMRAANLFDSTILILSADHGESLWEHMGWGHAYDLYDEQIHVPLVIAGPGIESGRIAQPVSAIDLLPTLAELMGAPIQQAWRGRSLASALAAPHAEFAATPSFAQATSFAPYNPEARQAIIEANWKLIQGLETGEQRLFNIETDPHEQHNLAETNPPELARLAERLATWRASFPASFAEFPGFEAEAPEDDFVEKMRALGYLAE